MFLFISKHLYLFISKVLFIYFLFVFLLSVNCWIFFLTKASEKVSFAHSEMGVLLYPKCPDLLPAT